MRNDKAARQDRPATTSTLEITTAAGREPTVDACWTAADAAELDVLVNALVLGFWEHRKHCQACRPEPCPRYEAWLAHEAGCKACRGIAPLTYGPPCDECQRFLAEHHACVRCSPCPSVQRAIAELLDWRTARALRSRAEYLRAEHETAGTVAI